MPLLSKKSPAAFGLLLCLAALYRCATLSGSGWDHLLVPLTMLSLLILALLPLKRAGFSENALAAALFPLGLAFFLRAFLMPCNCPAKRQIMETPCPSHLPCSPDVFPLLRSREKFAGN